MNQHPRSRVSALVVTTAALVACAAQKTNEAKTPAAPAASPQEQAAPGGAYAQPPPAPPTPAAEPATRPPAAAPVPESTPPNRSVALREASGDIETAQRELDVAGGDCRNACRALGSMDRAAGRLCRLAQGEDELRRCTDARTRVYSARDKVRNTCGTCADVSVERNAPIPSR